MHEVLIVASPVHGEGALRSANRDGSSKKQHKQDFKMRKVLIVTVGLASLGTFASVQPAFAEKKTVCYDHYIIIGPTFKLSSHCRTDEAWKQNNCKITTQAGGANLKECFETEVLLPKDWKAASANGINKPFNPSTNLKNK